MESTGIKKKKVAIVHDALCVSGGAERVVLWMSEAYPEAPIYTSVYLADQTFPEFKGKEIHTLPFSRLIKTERQFKLLLPLWLLEIQNWKFREYETVLSSSTYLAKYIHPGKEVKHRAYVYAPFRFLWKPETYSADSVPTSGWMTWLIKIFLPVLRRWDKQATRKIPSIATSCQNMVREIEKNYHMRSVVIFPPISVKDYPVASSYGDYFLTVSRLISHKRVDVAIDACNRLKQKLIVVGDGPERESLAQRAGDSIQFVGRIPDDELRQLYVHAKALIFPSHEDYGIVPLESQACGVPVIALGKGGALETIKEGETGVFFNEQTADSLLEAIKAFETKTFSPDKIRAWAGNFDRENFIKELKRFVDS